MITRPFGSTGIDVSALGFGAGHLDRAEDPASTLDAALDAGITLFDTARGYGSSESAIGKWIGPHRDKLTLVTKVGYDVDGHEDWTGGAVTVGIDRALGQLQTDYLDVVLLHSCSLEVLRRGEVISALSDAVAAGKVRVMGYSGDNDELKWAVRSRRFGAIETSVNFVDQWSARHVVTEAAAQGLGVIAKRPMANAAWRANVRPVGQYSEEYWLRLRNIATEHPQLLADPSMMETAIRFSAFVPGVSCAIGGSAKAHHVQELANYVNAGPLPEAKVEHWTRAAAAHSDWKGMI